MKKKTMGERIREHRASLYSQADLANVTRLSRQTISGLERGTIKHPKAETLQRIAKAFMTSVDWLLTGRRR